MKDSLLYKRCMKLEKEINKLNEIIKEYDKKANEYYKALLDIKEYALSYNSVIGNKEETIISKNELCKRFREELLEIINKALGDDKNGEIK